VEARRTLLGDDHRDTLVSMSNLARTYVNQGRWKDAERMLVDSMDVMTRALGDEHPDTLTLIANLAFLYRSHGQWDEAEPLAIKAAEGRRRVMVFAEWSRSRLATTIPFFFSPQLLLDDIINRGDTAVAGAVNAM
jgi:hypothetical protein